MNTERWHYTPARGKHTLLWQFPLTLKVEAEGRKRAEIIDSEAVVQEEAKFATATKHQVNLAPWQQQLACIHHKCSWYSAVRLQMHYTWHPGEG